MFNLEKWLTSVRHQPEHIRIRYVWGSVAASMFLILLLWAFSIKEMFNQPADNGGPSAFSQLKERLSQTSQEESSQLKQTLDEKKVELDQQLQNEIAKDAFPILPGADQSQPGPLPGSPETNY